MQDELIQAAIRGEEPACRDLFDQWWAKAYRVGKAICGNRGAAEDAVQEALLRFWRALPGLKKPEAAQGYFLRIVANEARRIRARRKASAAESLPEDLQHADDGEERAQRAELKKAVEKLPESLRAAVQLHYYGGFSEAETAGMLGTTKSSVKMRLLRARRKLRVYLEQEGYEVTGG